MPAGEHVMPPDQKTKQRDGDTAVGNESIAEDRFSTEHRNDFTDDPHGWQNHNVDRRMRIEPKEMLEEKQHEADAYKKRMEEWSAEIAKNEAKMNS